MPTGRLILFQCAADLGKSHRPDELWDQSGRGRKESGSWGQTSLGLKPPPFLLNSTQKGYRKSSPGVSHPATGSSVATVLRVGKTVTPSTFLTGRFQALPLPYLRTG